MLESLLSMVDTQLKVGDIEGAIGTVKRALSAALTNAVKSFFPDTQEPSLEQRYIALCMLGLGSEYSSFRRMENTPEEIRRLAAFVRQLVEKTPK